MKRYFLLAAAAIGMMAACSKTEVQPTSKPIDDTTREAVKFSIDAPSLVKATTKGVGAIDEWNKNDNLYILGYVRNPETYALENALIPNVKAGAPDGGDKGWLILTQTTVDENGQNEKEEPYYYANSSSYDFFGYYIDDAKDENGDTPEYVGNANSGSISFVIDGTQDIMAAKAKQEDDVEGTSVKATNAYSAYAARRNVHPTLKFNHLLTRFNFYVVAGSESGANVNVEKITISSKTAATLTVAPEVVLTPSGTATPLELKQTATDSRALVELEPKKPYMKAGYKYDVKEVLNTEAAKIGSSIIVMPNEESHTITVSVNNPESNLKIEDTEVTLNASDVKGNVSTYGKFLPGYQYDVILTVYGAEPVKIAAVLSEWEEGGSSFIDPDDMFDEEPTEPSAKLTAATANSLTYEIVAPNNVTNLLAGLSTDGINIIPETSQSVVLTKAMNGKVTFMGLNAGVNYYCHLYYKVIGEENYKAASVAEPVKTSKITVLGSLCVDDMESFLMIPEEYRRTIGTWMDVDESTLPWLVAWLMPSEAYRVRIDNEPEFNESYTLDPTSSSLLVIKNDDAFKAKFQGGITPGNWYMRVSNVEEDVVITVLDRNFSVNKSYVVEATEESYYQLPDTYTILYPWAQHEQSLKTGENNLPWLAAEFTPTTKLEVEATCGSFVFKKIFEKATTCSLLTLSAAELGLETLTPGEWTLKLNGYVQKLTVK